MQQIAIISSSKDSAGMNIRNNLIELFNFKKIDEKSITEKFGFGQIFQHNNVKLYTINQELIFAENIDKTIDADVFIFASKHRSRENKPAFTAHPIGNWDKAEFGGKERMLCPSSAFLLKNIFSELNENFSAFCGGKIFDVTMEATHHGPYAEKPSVFVEIGSADSEWSDTLNGSIIAKAIVNSIEIFSASKSTSKGQGNLISALLLGGGHYTQAGNNAMLKTDYAIGHICPKHMLEYLDENMLIQAISKIIPKPEVVLLDWKGLGSNKQKIVKLLEKLSIGYEKI